MKFSLMSEGNPQEKAEHFLEHSEKFRLGDLLTECSHPETRELSELAKNDLPAALDTLRAVDRRAIEFLLQKSDELNNLKQAIKDTISSGHKVFLSGCGATGRLSLKLEFLWGQEFPEKKDQVIGFMAGGDVAFIRSIESFEDHFDFGARQSQDLGFSENDLMIGITEGGETSFVIGAVEEAARKSSRRPFFIYCNPSNLLKNKVERSKRVLENEAIEKIDLSNEPMALSGSTRMQATTVQLLAVASCLLTEKSVSEYISGFVELFDKNNYSFLSDFIFSETETYENGHGVIYSTDEFGMTILTDTTERAPTFSLPPFENFDDADAAKSLCYFNVKGSSSATCSWSRLLGREPRTLGWKQYLHLAGPERINGYDFSDEVFDKRKSLSHQEEFLIARDEDGNVKLSFKDLNAVLEISRQPLFYQHLLLKLFLNAHSTLIMGRLGRYEGNWMTWVKPSNGKLIDRAIRYIQGLGKKRGHDFSYPETAKAVFQEIEHLQDGEAIVLKALGRLERK